MATSKDNLTKVSDRVLEASAEVIAAEREKRTKPIGTADFGRLARDAAAWSREAADMAQDELRLAEETTARPGETIDDPAPDEGDVGSISPRPDHRDPSS